MLVGFSDSLVGEPDGEDEPPLGFTDTLEGGPGRDELVGGGPVGDTTTQVVGIGQTVTYLVT